MNNNHSNGDSLTKQSLFLTAGRSVAYGMNMVVPVLLVRIFDQSEYGLYKQLFLIFSTLFSVGQLGMSQSLYYFLPRHPEDRNRIMTQTFFFVLITGLILWVGMVVFEFSIGRFMNAPAMTAFMPLLGLYTFLMIGASFLETGMIAEGNARWASVVVVLSQFLNSSILVLSSLLFKNLYMLFAGATIFAALRFGGQCIYLFKRYNISHRTVNFSLFREQLKYSLPIGAGNVAWLIQGKLHQFFISAFFNPAIFAVYAVGCFKLPLLDIITGSVGSVMVPAISRHQKDGDTRRILEIWNRAIKKMNLMLMPVFVFFFFTAEVFITVLFTADYADSVPIFRIGLFLILISSINTGAVLQAYAKTRYVMNIALLRLPVTAGLLWVFIQQWGVLGAVSADVLAMVAFRLVVLGKVARVLGLPFSKVIDWSMNGRILLMALLAGMPVLVLTHLIADSPLLCLAASGIIYPLLYGILMVRSTCLAREEKAELIENVTLLLNGIKRMGRVRASR